jgi:ABC-type proline/glycine betaine transport system permease subunit
LLVIIAVLLAVIVGLIIALIIMNRSQIRNRWRSHSN